MKPRDNCLGFLSFFRAPVVELPQIEKELIFKNDVQAINHFIITHAEKIRKYPGILIDALIIAIINLRYEVINFLLNTNLNPNTKTLNDNHTNSYALSWAAEAVDLKIVKLLLDAGANVDLIEKTGDTVLHVVVSNLATVDIQRSKILKLLIPLAADINHKNKENLTPLEVLIDAIELFRKSFDRIVMWRSMLLIFIKHGATVTPRMLGLFKNSSKPHHAGLYDIFLTAQNEQRHLPSRKKIA